MKNLKKLTVGIVAISMALSSFAQDKLVIKGSDTLGAKMIPKFISKCRRCLISLSYCVAVVWYHFGIV